MSTAKVQEKESRIDAPYHNQFYRIADMLATPCADKRVDALSSMVESRKFTIEEITSFVEVWLTTQSKFPVLADIYAYTHKKLEKKKECTNLEPLQIELDSHSTLSEKMAKLKSLNVLIDNWIESGRQNKFCCYREENICIFWENYERFRTNYAVLTENEVVKALKFVEYRLKNNGNKPETPKNERGCQD